MESVEFLKGRFQVGHCFSYFHRHFGREGGTFQETQHCLVRMSGILSVAGRPVAVRGRNGNFAKCGGQIEFDCKELESASFERFNQLLVALQ